MYFDCAPLLGSSTKLIVLCHSVYLEIQVTFLNYLHILPVFAIATDCYGLQYAGKEDQ